MNDTTRTAAFDAKRLREIVSAVMRSNMSVGYSYDRLCQLDALASYADEMGCATVNLLADDLEWLHSVTSQLKRQSAVAA